jgi:uncharacterized protein YggL (DUF469 family)
MKMRRPRKRTLVGDYQVILKGASELLKAIKDLKQHAEYVKELSRVYAQNMYDVSGGGYYPEQYTPGSMLEIYKLSDEFKYKQKEILEEARSILGDISLTTEGATMDRIYNAKAAWHRLLQSDYQMYWHLYDWD